MIMYVVSKVRCFWDGYRYSKPSIVNGKAFEALDKACEWVVADASSSELIVHERDFTDANGLLLTVEVGTEEGYIGYTNQYLIQCFTVEEVQQ